MVGLLWVVRHRFCVGLHVHTSIEYAAFRPTEQRHSTNNSKIEWIAAMGCCYDSNFSACR